MSSGQEEALQSSLALLDIVRKGHFIISDDKSKTNKDVEKEKENVEPETRSERSVQLIRDYRLKRAISFARKRRYISFNARGGKLLEDQEDKFGTMDKKEEITLGQRPGKDHKAIREKTLAMMRQKKNPCLAEEDMTLGIHWVRHLIERRPNLQVCERLVYVNLDGVIDETDSSDFEY